MNTKTSADFRIKINAIRMVLIFSVLIMAIEFFAFYVSKSNAILSDALESFINIATSGFTLYSIYYSSKLRDNDHPYGHGKIEYLAVGFEGVLIVGTGFYLLIKSGFNLFHPVELQNVNGGIILTALSGLAMYFIGSFLKRKGRELNSLPLIADGSHFHLDTLTSLALVTGLLIYHITGWRWIDSVLAILLAFHIMGSGIKLLKQSINHLMDKADLETIAQVVTALQKNRNENRIDIHNLRVQKFGSALHIDCHITLPFYFTLNQVHDEIKLLEHDMNIEFQQGVELFVHTDPCQQLPCDICNVQECAFRTKSFVKKLEWNSELLMQNKKHSIEDSKL